MLDKIILQELKLTVEKEYVFHPTRKWRADWSIPSHKIIIEEEGGVWKKNGGGRHNRGAGFIADMEKYNTATAMGWRIFRIVPGDYGKALRFIEQLIKTESNESGK
jgi:very-short-patch-repair endonuclease